MKKSVCFTLVIFAAVYAQAAIIEQVIVRQQWPWSTDVKVEYRLSGVDVQHPVNIGVKAYNGDVELDASRLEQSITGDRYGICESGVGQFIIDPVAAFGTSKVALANFKVKLTLSDSDSNAGEVIYKIFDLEKTNADGTFACEDVTRADIKNNHYGDFEIAYNQIVPGCSTTLGDVLVWTGVTNYPGAKTTKLVMRKISAGTFSMGATGGSFSGDVADNAAQVHSVTLTKDYYIGVYPVTQEQYRKLTKGYWSGSGHKGDALPVESATYEVFQSVVTNGIAANLGVQVNYPSEAQWEFACRAGTTTELYTGESLSSANLDPIAWNSGNSDGNTHEVGLKLPNAYGLYDMIGNVYEACRDGFKAASQVVGYSDGSAVSDPEEPGPASGSPYVMRGGYFNLSNIHLTSPGRAGHAGNWTAYGFRLAFTVGE